MTPAALRTALEALGWSQRGLAALLGLDSRQVRRWASGEAAVPCDVASWLEAVVRELAGPRRAWLEIRAAFHAAHPAPGRGE